MSAPRVRGVCGEPSMPIVYAFALIVGSGDAWLFASYSGLLAFEQARDIGVMAIDNYS